MSVRVCGAYRLHRCVVVVIGPIPQLVVQIMRDILVPLYHQTNRLLYQFVPVCTTHWLAFVGLNP